MTNCVLTHKAAIHAPVLLDTLSFLPDIARQTTVSFTTSLSSFPPTATLLLLDSPRPYVMYFATLPSFPTHSLSGRMFHATDTGRLSVCVQPALTMRSFKLDRE